jgi:hypothetical protein
MPKKQKKISRQLRWQGKQLDAHKCWKCGEPTEKKENGEHYRLCASHREADLLRKAA